MEAEQAVKLLLRGYDKDGQNVKDLTRAFDVHQPGDGIFNVSVLSAVTVSISVVEDE